MTDSRPQPGGLGGQHSLASASSLIFIKTYVNHLIGILWGHSAWDWIKSKPGDIAVRCGKLLGLSCTILAVVYYGLRNDKLARWTAGKEFWALCRSDPVPDDLNCSLVAGKTLTPPPYLDSGRIFLPDRRWESGINSSIEESSRSSRYATLSVIYVGIMAGLAICYSMSFIWRHYCQRCHRHINGGSLHNDHVSVASSSEDERDGEYYRHDDDAGDGNGSLGDDISEDTGAKHGIYGTDSVASIISRFKLGHQISDQHTHEGVLNRKAAAREVQQVGQGTFTDEASEKQDCNTKAKHRSAEAHHNRVSSVPVQHQSSGQNNGTATGRSSAITEVSQHVNQETRKRKLGPGSTTLTLWRCGYCGWAGMRMINHDHCVYCHTRRNVFSETRLAETWTCHKCSQHQQNLGEGCVNCGHGPCGGCGAQ